jgi:hypothetical protein
VLQTHSPTALQVCVRVPRRSPGAPLPASSLHTRGSPAPHTGPQDSAASCTLRAAQLMHGRVVTDSRNQLVCLLCCAHAVVLLAQTCCWPAADAAHNEHQHDVVSAACGAVSLRRACLRGVQAPHALHSTSHATTSRCPPPTHTHTRCLNLQASRRGPQGQGGAGDGRHVRHRHGHRRVPGGCVCVCPCGCGCVLRCAAWCALSPAATLACSGLRALQRCVSCSGCWRARMAPRCLRGSPLLLC